MLFSLQHWFQAGDKWTTYIGYHTRRTANRSAVHAQVTTGMRDTEQGTTSLVSVTIIFIRHAGVAHQRYDVRLRRGRARVRAPSTLAIFHLPTYINCTSLIWLYHIVLALHINWKKIKTDPQYKEKDPDILRIGLIQFEFSPTRNCPFRS
jgi:hypothetical protein